MEKKKKAGEWGRRRDTTPVEVSGTKCTDKYKQKMGNSVKNSI